MNNGILFDWPTAVRAARAGHYVRRRGWTEVVDGETVVSKWLQLYGGLWWVRINGEPVRVVQATDFGKEEFLAKDWTHLPIDCLVEAQEAKGTKCPAPFTPSDPGTVTPPPQPGGSLGETGTVAPSGSAATAGTTDSTAAAGGGSGATGVSNPGGGGGDAPPTFIGAPGSGGSGGGVAPYGPVSAPPRASVAWPDLTIELTDWTFEADPEGCYPSDGEQSPQNMTIAGTVALGETADTDAGGAAAGLYNVSVQYAGEILWSGTINPGESLEIGFHSIGPGNPGSSSFTLSARAWLGGSNCGDITDTATISMAPWCEESSGGMVGGP